MVSKELVSKVFTGVAIVLGVSSLIAVGVGKPLPAIPLAVLAVGSEYASYLHSKLA